MWPVDASPFTSDRSAITFNGEIYNHRELRQRHLSDRPAHTRTDTEVILQLYATLRAALRRIARRDVCHRHRR